MQCVQRTDGVGPSTLDAVGNEGEEVRLFITPYQTNFFILGNPTAKEMMPY